MPPPPPKGQYRNVSVQPCPNTSVGLSGNEEFAAYSQGAPTRNNEDRYYNGFLNGVQLCAVLDGHDGEGAADFTCKCLADMLLHNIPEDGGEELVRSTIMKAFRDTETQFFVKIDDAVIRRQTLMEEMSQRAINSYEAQRLFPGQVAEIERLNQQIMGGTTVALSVIHNDRLYVANVGDSRAVLCFFDSRHELQATQISDVHNVYNPTEQRRLANLGLVVDDLVRFGRLGPYQVTRSIGDYAIKGGYKDVDILSHARDDPGIAEPFINGPWTVSKLNGFLLLMSDGLYEAYGKYAATTKPQEINHGLSMLVAEELKRQASLETVAQTVVERVKVLYKQKVGKGKLDDITLIVYNFSSYFSSAQRMADPHLRSQYSQPHPQAYPSSVAQPAYHPRQPSNEGGGGYFFPEVDDPYNQQPASGRAGYPQPAQYRGDMLLNVGQNPGLTSSGSDSRLDQYGRDNTQYPPAHVSPAVNRTPVSMHRVPSGPTNLHNAGADLSDGMAAMHLTPNPRAHPQLSQPPQHERTPPHGYGQNEQQWPSGGRSPLQTKKPVPPVEATDSPPGQPPSVQDADDSTSIKSYVEFPRDFPYHLGIDDF